jgi:hypothetical protein
LGDRGGQYNKSLSSGGKAAAIDHKSEGSELSLTPHAQAKAKAGIWCVKCVPPRK